MLFVSFFSSFVTHVLLLITLSLTAKKKREMIKKREILIGVSCLITFVVFLLLGLALTGVFDASPQVLDTSSTLEPPTDVPPSVPMFTRVNASKQISLRQFNQK